MEVKNLIDEVNMRMIDVRRRIHMNPELGCKEFKTTELIREELVKEGIKILNYELETGVIALIEGRDAGRTIAMRGDIDALAIQEETNLNYASKNKGVMHACGHDMHAAIILGTGIVLNKLKDKFAGNVILIFQPGEETGDGASKICKTGVFEDFNVKSLAGIHISPLIDIGKVGIKYGQFMAAASYIKIKLKGKGGHGAHPEKTVDPIVISSYVVTALQTLVSRNTDPLETLVVSICRINGGSGFNIVPEEVVMEGTVRTLSFAIQDKIEAMIRKVVCGVAESFGGSAEVTFNLETLPLVNDDDIVDDFKFSFSKTLGSDKVEFIEKASTGSEDFSEYSKYTEIAYCKIGSKGDNPSSAYPNHNSKVVPDEGAIRVGINIMSNYAIDVLNR